MGSESTKQKKQFDIDGLLLPLRLNTLVDNRLYETTKVIITHLHKGEYLQVKDYFHNREKTIIQSDKYPLICSRLNKKDEAVYQCRTCSYIEGGIYFCSNCFVRELHENHDFRVIENEKYMCSCGNDQVLDQSCFCKNHFKEKIEGKPMDIKLKKELKFSIELLLFLKQEPKMLRLQPQSFQRFGQPLLQYLLHASKADTSYSRGIAEVLLQKVDILTNSEVELKSLGLNLLQNLLLTCSQIQLLANLLVELTNQLFLINEIGVQLLRIAYNTILNADVSKSVNNIFQKLRYDFFLCDKNQTKYFANPNNCHFFIKRRVDTLEDIEHYYPIFYMALSKILKLRNSKQIMENIMKKTRISEIFNFQKFYEAIPSSGLKKLQIQSFMLSRKIISMINDKKLLFDIALDSLSSVIKKKTVMFDLFFERSFALALYHYYDFKLPEKDEIMTTLSHLIPQLQQNLEEMLIRFITVRQTYSQDYDSLIRKNTVVEDCSSLTILATDHLYLMILCSFFSTKESIAVLYKDYIAKKVLNSNHHFEEKVKQVAANTKSVKETLTKFNTFFSVLNNSIMTQASELIIHGNGDSKSSESILNYLSLIYEGCSAVQFKTFAEKFAKSTEVVKFIKERLFLQGKKIHSKAQIKNNVAISPFSELITSNLPEIVMERMANIYSQRIYQSERFKLFASEECLHDWLLLLETCIDYIQKNADSESQLQAELKKVIENLLSLGYESKSKDYFALIQRIHKKTSNTSSILEYYLKKTYENLEVQQPQNNKNSKKKQKLNEMKEKQKNLLKAYHMEEEIRVEQCIVCKNSKSGNPFLLANFGYKNIFSKVLQTSTPFLEFSSCGHYIHEECLVQSHKGDFKIWYPCILCKSICNILLPNISNQRNQSQTQSYDNKLQRVITFLKNLGGIYTFFYQDRKELIEFNLEKVEDIFPLLFKTLVYQVTFYPILNLQYFQRSQLPVTKFLFDLLLFTFQKLKGIHIIKNIEITGHPFFVSLYRYVTYRLTSFFSHQSEAAHVLNEKELPHDVVNLVNEIISLLESKGQNLEITAKPSKDYRDLVVQGFIKPSNDLKEMQSKSQECRSCQKSVTNYELCLLCGWSCCAKCTEVKKVHALEEHLSQCVFIRNTNGKYVYVHEELLGEFNSLYVDYLGEEYNGLQKVGQGEFQISKERWDNLIEDLLSNRMHREVMKFQ